MENEHIAARPSWDCVACDKPWPCDPAREFLVWEMDTVRLSVYLWGSLEEAVGDLPAMPAAEAFDRFMAWVPRPPIRTCLGTIDGVEAWCGRADAHDEH